MGNKREPKQAFAAPWHAEVFALAVYLNEAGHFSWAEWSSRFGKNLAAASNNSVSTANEQGPDGSEDYYQMWLQTLIEIMQERGIVDLELLSAFEAQWADAYTKTPHGHPVTL